MASLNRVDIIGRLGADPEVRRLSSGDPVVNLRVAVTDSWRDKQSGERRERTEWVSVVIFNEGLAKVAEQYLKKGAQVFLSGSLQTRKWQDQQGNDKYTTEVVLQKFRGELQMLDSRSQSDDRQSSPRQEQSGYEANPGEGSRPDLDDEIPFLMEWR